MAWDATKPTNDGLLINAPGELRANFDAIALGTDAALLITNAKVSASAAIVESKLLFSGSGHGHTGGTDGKQIVLSTGTSGVLATARGGTGSSATANTADGLVILTAAGYLPALNASLLTGLTAAQIPSLDASKITTGYLGTARLGSGSASASTYLRGDQSWQALTFNIPNATPGSLVELNASTSRSVSAGSYTKYKQVTPITRAGIYTISFGMYVSGGINGRVYVNDIAVGTPRSTGNNGPSFTTWSEDFSLALGDVVSIYCYVSSGSGVVGVFQIRCAVPMVLQEVSGY